MIGSAVEDSKVNDIGEELKIERVEDMPELAGYEKSWDEELKASRIESSTKNATTTSDSNEISTLERAEGTEHVTKLHGGWTGHEKSETNISRKIALRDFNDDFDSGGEYEVTMISQRDPTISIGGHGVVHEIHERKIDKHEHEMSTVLNNSNIKSSERNIHPQHTERHQISAASSSDSNFSDSESILGFRRRRADSVCVIPDEEADELNASLVQYEHLDLTSMYIEKKSDDKNVPPTPQFSIEDEIWRDLQSTYKIEKQRHSSPHTNTNGSHHYPTNEYDEMENLYDESSLYRHKKPNPFLVVRDGNEDEEEFVLSATTESNIFVNTKDSQIKTMPHKRVISNGWA